MCKQRFTTYIKNVLHSVTHKPPRKWGNANSNILSRASTVTLWFQFGCGLERKIKLWCALYIFKRGV